MTVNIGNIQQRVAKIGGRKHYPWLDLIRFIAAFAVMAGHYRGAFLPEYSDIPPEQRNISIFLFYTITHFPAEAVLLFFVLSGFLVGGKVNKAGELIGSAQHHQYSALGANGYAVLNNASATMAAMNVRRNTLHNTLRSVTYVPRECSTVDAAHW